MQIGIAGDLSRIVECNCVRVGILGITMDSEVPEKVLRAAEGGFCLLPPIPTAKSAIRELADETDLTLVLLAGDDDDVARFAREVPETDIIVGGGCPRATCNRPTELPSAMGHTIVNAGGVRGQRVGVTTLIVSPRNEVADSHASAVTLRRGMSEDSLIAREVRRVLEIIRQERRSRYRR